MKRIALAIALACVLSGSVLGGDSHTGGAPGNIPTGDAPGQGDVPKGQDATAPGDMGGGGAVGDVGTGGAAVLLTILDLVF